ncbi:MAG: DUF2905 domain-containing protein [Nitrospirales bacterium]|nr:DUF2905 domain-containing protein [Nitrospirales bacterium]
MQHIGRLLLVIGVIIAIVGLFFIYSGKIPLIGRLPGDIIIQRKNFTFYFPLATSIIVSLVLTVIVWILGRR